VDDSKLLKTGCSEENLDLTASIMKMEKIHNKELPNVGSLQNIKINKLRGMRCPGYVALMGEMRNGMQNLSGRPRSRCEDNIKTDLDLRETG
jgi:hypothetical protein